MCVRDAFSCTEKVFARDHHTTEQALVFLYVFFYGIHVDSFQRGRHHPHYFLVFWKTLQGVYQCPFCHSGVPERKALPHYAALRVTTLRPPCLHDLFSKSPGETKLGSCYRQRTSLARAPRTPPRVFGAKDTWPEAVRIPPRPEAAHLVSDLQKLAMSSHAIVQSHQQPSLLVLEDAFGSHACVVSSWYEDALVRTQAPHGMQHRKNVLRSCLF